jgi:hypothetical protein
MLLDSEQKIARPKQIYVGSGPRDYVGIGQRTPAPVKSAVEAGR